MYSNFALSGENSRTLNYKKMFPPWLQAYVWGYQQGKSLKLPQKSSYI